MGLYYNPDEVETIGKRVYKDRRGNPPFIPSGYKLIAVMDRGVRKIAPDVTRPGEFEHFYNKYASGDYLSMELYLVREGELK